MTLYIGARTDAGLRDNNEDCVAVIRDTDVKINANAVLIIADGMGGRASGEHASACAVDTVRETLESLLAVGEGVPPPYEDALASAMRRANARVYEMSRATAGKKGMGTTCITAVIGDGSLSLAHVGDSRAYLLRDGILRRLTEDHSYIQDQVRSGNLSDHDARNSRFRHVITRAIGVEATVNPDFQSHSLQEGDILLLCTDGLSGVVDEAGMIQIMTRTLNAQAASDYLIDAAKRQGSKDNISNIVVRYGGEPEPPIDEAVALPLETDGFPVVRPVRGTSLWAMVASLLLGALLMFLALWTYTTYHHARHPVARRAPAPAVAPPPPAPAVPADYLPPRLLLAGDVLGDIIAGSDTGVVVADASTGALWSVNTIGQVRQVGALPAPRSRRDRYSSRHDFGRSDGPEYFIAADNSGRTYVSSPSEQVIRRYSADGVFERTIDQGLLQHPQALWVARNGDIYVIDNGKLNLIAAIAGTPASHPAHAGTGAATGSGSAGSSGTGVSTAAGAGVAGSSDKAGSEKAAGENRTRRE